jgi:endonuclease YncB( thermonuclease family)
VNGIDCRILRLLDDGTLVVSADDGERAVRIHGVDVPSPPPEGYGQILERLSASARALRCTPPTAQSGDTAKLYYFGWQDKSGDVWLDLAATLLEEGLVRVGNGSFPEREEYLQYEHQARDQRIGIWA